MCIAYINQKDCDKASYNPHRRTHAARVGFTSIMTHLLPFSNITVADKEFSRI